MSAFRTRLNVLGLERRDMPSATLGLPAPTPLRIELENVLVSGYQNSSGAAASANPQGRIVLGTDQGVWRASGGAVTSGFAYQTLTVGGSSNL